MKTVNSNRGFHHRWTTAKLHCELRWHSEDTRSGQSTRTRWRPSAHSRRCCNVRGSWPSQAPCSTRRVPDSRRRWERGILPRWRAPLPWRSCFFCRASRRRLIAPDTAGWPQSELARGAAGSRLAGLNAQRPRLHGALAEAEGGRCFSREGGEAGEDCDGGGAVPGARGGQAGCPEEAQARPQALAAVRRCTLRSPRMRHRLPRAAVRKRRLRRRMRARSMSSS